MESKDILSEEMVERCRQLFRTFDKDGTGTVPAADLHKIFDTLGIKIDSTHLVTILKNVSRKHSDVLDFSSFVKLMESAIKTVSDNPIEAFQILFNIADTQKQGFLTFPQFQKFVEVLTPPGNQLFIDSVLRIVQTDSFGHINLEAFINALQLCSPHA